MVRSVGFTFIVLTGWVLTHAASRDVIDLAVPDRANAYASIAASGRLTVIAWGATTRDGATDVYTAVSEDGGRSFGGPSRVNTVADRSNRSGEQPPRIALLRRANAVPTIVVVWTAKTPTGTRPRSPSPRVVGSALLGTSSPLARGISPSLEGRLIRMAPRHSRGRRSWMTAPQAIQSWRRLRRRRSSDGPAARQDKRSFE